MERYLGADVHAASVTFSVLNESGKQLRRDVVETNGKALVGYLQQIPGQLHLCIEEGEWSQWLYEILSPSVAEMVVYRSEWKPGVKSDAIDAHGLAEKLRTGTVGRGVYKDAHRYTALREKARAYGMVTRDVIRVKSRLKSFYRARGVSCAGEAVYKPEERGKRARALLPATRQVVELLGRELDALQALKAEAEKAMLQESHRHRITRILETAPGFGPVRVAQMLPIVITPWRFRTKRQFWAYCGLAVVTVSSSDWAPNGEGGFRAKRRSLTRGLNRNRNPLLKEVFKGAALTVIQAMPQDPLAKNYRRLVEQERLDPALARLTVARQIAAIVLAMWKKQEAYDPTRYQSSKTA
jgi:transposase